MPNFDETDLLLLRELRNNARISNKALAARADIAPSTCLARVQRLEKSGVIIGYHAELNPVAIGIGIQAMIAVQLEKHVRKLLESLQEYLLQEEEVLTVYQLTGKDDFLVHVAVRDTDDLHNYVLRLVDRPEITRVETHLIYEQNRHPSLPVYR
ncbi:MAG TPA: Lrp/AsnC family transcriptional regulator [Gammaproteobacteria bacterium]|nr:Lrp/AsnC family transcriptional regulator [Gammaproteobacteria bacterium]